MEEKRLNLNEISSNNNVYTYGDESARFVTINIENCENYERHIKAMQTGQKGTLLLITTYFYKKGKLFDIKEETNFLPEIRIRPTKETGNYQLYS